MRFDDSLKTVLAAEASTTLGARAAFRQLVDLIGRRRASASDDLLWRLEQLRDKVPVAVRISCARSLALVDAPVALVGFFADDLPEVGAVALRAARLDPDEWEQLLPRLGPHSRGVLRQRADLAPSVLRALDSFGASDLLLTYRPAHAPTRAAPVERFRIADLVGRIEAHQRAHTVPDDDAVPPLTGFRFETDAGGAINWVDACPRSAVIGLTLDHRGGGVVAPAVDGVAAGAFVWCGIGLLFAFLFERSRTAVATLRFMLTRTVALLMLAAGAAYLVGLLWVEPERDFMEAQLKGASCGKYTGVIEKGWEQICADSKQPQTP